MHQGWGQHSRLGSLRAGCGRPSLHRNDAPPRLIGPGGGGERVCAVQANIRPRDLLGTLQQDTPGGAAALQPLVFPKGTLSGTEQFFSFPHILASQLHHGAPIWRTVIGRCQ